MDEFFEILNGQEMEGWRRWPDDVTPEPDKFEYMSIGSSLYYRFAKPVEVDKTIRRRRINRLTRRRLSGRFLARRGYKKCTRGYTFIENGVKQKTDER